MSSQDQSSASTKPLIAFGYLSFDVVGTLIDFETAILDGLEAPAKEAGVELDANVVFALYREARQQPGAVRCPDDLGRCYSVIATRLGLPDTKAYQDAMIEAVAEAKPFPDSVAALAVLKKHYKLIAMTNARRWGFDRYEKKLGNPFWASLTSDETGCEKPDPAFFYKAFELVEQDGGTKNDILHAAQSQYHDMAVSRSLGMTNCWIERRHEQEGYGGTLEPENFTKPDYHFLSMKALAAAVSEAF